MSLHRKVGWIQCDPITLLISLINDDIGTFFFVFSLLLPSLNVERPERVFLLPLFLPRQIGRNNKMRELAKFKC